MITKNVLNIDSLFNVNECKFSFEIDPPTVDVYFTEDINVTWLRFMGRAILKNGQLASYSTALKGNIQKGIFTEEDLKRAWNDN